MAATAIQPVIVSALLYFFLGILFNSSASCEAVNMLYTNESLYSGNFLESGSNMLVMQDDCNLVLTRNKTFIWASNTGLMGKGCYCKMQSDGNLVIYERPKRLVWTTNASAVNGDYVFVLQRDGNLVIYGEAIWSAGTRGPWKQGENQLNHPKALRRSEGLRAEKENQAK